MNYFIKLSFLLLKQGARAGQSRGPHTWSALVRAVAAEPPSAQAGPRGREPVGLRRGRAPSHTGAGEAGAGKVFEEIYSDVLLREGHPSRGSAYKNFPAC